MKRLILILSLIIKGIIDFIFVTIVALTIGIAVFIITYIYYSIEKIIDLYYTHKDN